MKSRWEEETTSTWLSFILTRRIYTCGADDWQHCGARNSHQLLDPGIPIGTGARLPMPLFVGTGQCCHDPDPSSSDPTLIDQVMMSQGLWEISIFGASGVMPRNKVAIAQSSRPKLCCNYIKLVSPESQWLHQYSPHSPSSIIHKLPSPFPSLEYHLSRMCSFLLKADPIR